MSCNIQHVPNANNHTRPHTSRPVIGTFMSLLHYETWNTLVAHITPYTCDRNAFRSPEPHLYDIAAITDPDTNVYRTNGVSSGRKVELPIPVVHFSSIPNKENQQIGCCLPSGFNQSVHLTPQWTQFIPATRKPVLRHGLMYMYNFCLKCSDVYEIIQIVEVNKEFFLRTTCHNFRYRTRLSIADYRKMQTFFSVGNNYTRCKTQCHGTMGSTTERPRRH